MKVQIELEVPDEFEMSVWRCEDGALILAHPGSFDGGVEVWRGQVKLGENELK